MFSFSKMRSQPRTTYDTKKGALLQESRAAAHEEKN
jgi:hypothetical protein